ncbi:MAG: gephyrin-like molybdotransferase Glp [Gammaproteobacteria bacterium]
MCAAQSGNCYEADTPMLGVDEAIATLLENANCTVSVRRIALAKAEGRILAEALVSPIDVPGFDNSAMDGYALNTRDLALARSHGLKITQRIAAGGTGSPLEPGCCARIFTGAPVPDGANCVAIQEVCRVENDRLLLDHDLQEHANIRPRGNDIAAGAVILERGTQLRAAQLGLAASVGIASANIYRKLRVAIFSTGDELVEPGQPLRAGQIYNSNRYQLHALLVAQGCKVIDLGTVADQPEATRHTLLKAADKSDLIITSGGVSVGEEDHVRAALEETGRVRLWRIRMKPGKPLVFGQVRNTPFIGLPGNPVSVFVTFLLFARPYLQALQGRAPGEPLSYPVRSAFGWRAGPRREYVRVRLSRAADGEVTAAAFPRQGSDVLSSVAWADGLVEVPENTDIQAGDTLRFLPMSEWTR